MANCCSQIRKCLLNETVIVVVMVLLIKMWDQEMNGIIVYHNLYYSRSILSRGLLNDWLISFWPFFKSSSRNFLKLFSDFPLKMESSISFFFALFDSEEIRVCSLDVRTPFDRSFCNKSGVGLRFSHTKMKSRWICLECWFSKWKPVCIYNLHALAYYITQYRGIWPNKFGSQLWNRVCIFIRIYALLDMQWLTNDEWRALKSFTTAEKRINEWNI